MFEKNLNFFFFKESYNKSNLDEPHLEEKYRKKIVVIKKQKTSYMGEKCTLVMVQDITAFHMVDKAIKDN